MTLATLQIPEKPPARPFWKQSAFWLQGVIGALSGGVLTYLALKAMKDTSGIEALAMVAAFVVITWAQIVLHEGGHAVGGLLSGHRAVAFGVGPLRLERQGERWRFHWANGVQGIGGFALLFPKAGEPSRGQSTAYLLGGPLSNLLVAALALPFAITDNGSDPDLGHIVARIVVGTGLLIGLFNLIPFVAGGWSSDGRQLLKLWQGADEARAAAFLMRLGGLSLAGVRPRDWPLAGAENVDLTALPQGVADAFARCRIIKALDERRFDDEAAIAAASALAEGFWRGPDGVRQINALMLARWVLEAEGNTALAEAWAAHSAGGLLDQSAGRAALAARIALHRGDTVEAAARLDEARGLRARLHDAASLAMFDEELALIEQRLAGA